MRTTAEYLALITSEHNEKPKFVATVEASVAPFAALQSTMRKFVRDFDVDSAIGVQLDIVGLWIGVTRIVAVPLDGYYFTWDDTVQTGWDNGVWIGIGDPTAGFTNLPDDLYRAVLKAKIRANNWKGDIPGAYEIVQQAFPTLGAGLTITDNQDMTMTVTIDEDALPAVERAIITQGYIPFKPAGVTAEYVTV
jgi:hypothetical protein